MILITGGAGFIGSHLVYALSNSVHEPIAVIDNLSTGEVRNFGKKVLFFREDLRRSKPTETILARIKPRMIFHLAADAAENRSFYVPRFAIEENINTYVNVLTPAIKNGLKKIIFTSSISVYGSQNPPFTESMKPDPVDIYGIAKTTNEALSRQMSSFYGFSYDIFRLHNVYGPGQSMTSPYRNLIAILINNILRRKKLYIYGDGTQKRAFTYIDDCIKLMMKASFDTRCDNQTLNLGSNEIQTVNTVVTELTRLFRYPKNRISFLPERKGEVKDSYCNNTRLETLTGITTTISLRSGLAALYETYRNSKPRTPVYMKSMELEDDSIPKTWSRRLI